MERNLNHEQVTHTSSLSCSSREDRVVLFFPFLLSRLFIPAAGTEEEQAKNFQWGFRRSTLNHLMCMSYTDVAQVANAARNYKILHDRDDDDTERPDKRNSGYGRDQRNRGQQSNRGECRRATTPIQFALIVDADTQDSVVELLADKKPGTSGRVFAIT
nr:hypothetical protein [Tanacetum cinerariifolium]